MSRDIQPYFYLSIFVELLVIIQIYSTYHTALFQAAASAIDNSLQAFADKFAPVPPEPDTRWLQILLDLVGMGATMIAGPFFNSCKLRLQCEIELENTKTPTPEWHRQANSRILDWTVLAKMPYFLANTATLANSKDTTFALISAGTSIAKDLLSGNSEM